MSSGNLSLPAPDTADMSHVEDADEHIDNETEPPDTPPGGRSGFFKNLSPFWHDRLIEGALIVSMALYYIIGNVHLGKGTLFHINPLVSLPFLLIFAVLCWYRLNFALALLPLGLPYYPLQKVVFSHYEFSIAEIALGVCVVVFLLQLVLRRQRWHLRALWRDVRDSLAPFALPVLVFFLAAAFSIVIAYTRRDAFRAFYEEVLGPLVYLLLALVCLRSRRDITRLLLAMIGTGFVVALLGLAQYFFFHNLLVLESDGIRRVHAMYGSANSIGLLFDYVMPVGLALIVSKIRPAVGILESLWFRVVLIVVYIPMFYILYLSQSRGAWFAIGAALVFIVALSMPNRKVLLIGGLAFIVVIAAVVLAFHTRLDEFIIGGHSDVNGVSSLDKRFYLWQVALNMIHDSPWFGYGMDNWLCHYSRNTVCLTPHLYHYWYSVPGAFRTLRDEPDLSHPHNIFLHVWVSMGVFGLLAFVSVLILFYWLFARILMHVHSNKVRGKWRLRWMTIGVGAAMLAALVQGQVDSAFLEQDLAFCFWILVAALLLLRVLSKTSWREGTQ